MSRARVTSSRKNTSAEAGWKRRAEAWRAAALAWKEYARRVELRTGSSLVSAGWLACNELHALATALDGRSPAIASSSRGSRKLAEARIAAESQAPIAIDRVECVSVWQCASCGARWHGNVRPARCLQCETPCDYGDGAAELARGVPPASGGGAGGPLGKIANTCSRANATPRHLRGCCWFWRSRDGYQSPHACVRRRIDGEVHGALCPACEGRRIPGAVCVGCSGKGYIGGPDILEGGRRRVELDCYACGGRGWLP